MKVLATFFGQTTMVRATPHNMREDEVPEHILWVERGEDLYALLSLKLRGKRVAAVQREDWLRATAGKCPT